MPKPRNSFDIVSRIPDDAAHTPQAVIPSRKELREEGIKIVKAPESPNPTCRHCNIIDCDGVPAGTVPDCNSPVNG